MKKLAIVDSSTASRLREAASQIFVVEIHEIPYGDPMFPTDNTTTTFGVGRNKTVANIEPPATHQNSVMLATSDVRSYLEYNYGWHPLLTGHEPVKIEFNWVVVLGGSKHAENVTNFLINDTTAKSWKVVQFEELVLVFFNGGDTAADYELAKSVDKLYLW